MDREVMHKKLYEAHRLLTAGAALLHDAVVDLTAEGRHKEEREKFAGVLSGLSAARDSADSAWSEANRARTDLIGLTGCDGNCA